MGRFDLRWRLGLSGRPRASPIAASILGASSLGGFDAIEKEVIELRQAFLAGGAGEGWADGAIRAKLPDLVRSLREDSPWDTARLLRPLPLAGAGVALAVFAHPTRLAFELT